MSDKCGYSGRFERQDRSWEGKFNIEMIDDSWSDERKLIKAKGWSDD